MTREVDHDDGVYRERGISEVPAQWLNETWAAGRMWPQNIYVPLHGKAEYLVLQYAGSKAVH